MDIQKKVRNLFAKAASTHSEHEAHAAILKAHELIAKYDVVLDDEADEAEEMVLEICKHPGNSGFRSILGPIIASNFKVCAFKMKDGSVAFFGHKTDVMVAKEVFEYAYRFANSKGRRIVNDLRGRYMNTDGVKQSYSLGFCQGLREKLDAQSVMLAVTVPQDVKDKCDEMLSKMKPQKRRKARNLNIKQYSPTYHELGRTDGREILNNFSQSGE